MRKILLSLLLALFASALAACSGSITTSQYAGQPRHLLPRDHQEYSAQAPSPRSGRAVPDLPRAAVATDGQVSIDEENTRLDRVMKICRDCLPSHVGAQEARRHEPSISRNETATIPATGAQN